MLVRPLDPATGAIVRAQRGVLSHEGIDAGQLRRTTRQFDGPAQIPRLDSQLAQRLRLRHPVSDPIRICVCASTAPDLFIHSVPFLVAHSHTSTVAHQQQLLLTLPALRQADTIVRKFWLDVRRDGNVSMKKLFVEMLESISSTNNTLPTATVV